MRPLDAKPRPPKVNGGVFSTPVSSEFIYDFIFNFNLVPAKEVQNSLIIEVEVEVEVI